jgi:hypothetical protein
MEKNRKTLYRLKRYKKVIEIVNQYQNKATTLRGLWQEYIFPVYPMGYRTFLRILEEKDIKKQISEMETKISEEKDIDD